MSNPSSPNCEISQLLKNIIKDDRMINNQLLLKVLEVIQKFLDNFDDFRTEHEKQDYKNKFEKDIFAVLHHHALSVNDINSIHREINQSFEQIENHLVSIKSIELKDLDILINSFAELKQLVDQAFSRLIRELNSIKTNMNTMKMDIDNLMNKVNKLEHESETMKTMNFLADLFNPVTAKLELLLLEKNLPITTLSKSKLEQIKKIMIHNNKKKVNDNNSEELDYIIEIIEKVSMEYGLESSVTIDYLIKKKNRNELMHYSRKIKEYAVSNASNNWSLNEFLLNEPELENHLYISQITALNGLFVSICGQLTR